MTGDPAEKKTGDAASFTIDWGAAYSRYARFWINLARSRGLSEGEAKDEVHEIVAVLMADSKRQFESAEHLRNYVARAVINRSIDEKQRPDRSAGMGNPFDPITPRVRDSDNSVEEDVQEAEFNRILREALLKLPRRGFEVVKLRFYCGFSFLEISHLLHLPISTLKSREDAALKRIREALRKMGF